MFLRNENKNNKMKQKLSYQCWTWQPKMRKRVPGGGTRVSTPLSLSLDIYPEDCKKTHAGPVL